MPTSFASHFDSLSESDRVLVAHQYDELVTLDSGIRAAWRRRANCVRHLQELLGDQGGIVYMGMGVDDPVLFDARSL